MEQWEPIPDFPNYMVSDWGRVKNIKEQIISIKNKGNNG